MKKHAEVSLLLPVTAEDLQSSSSLAAIAASPTVRQCVLLCPSRDADAIEQQVASLKGVRVVATDLLIGAEGIVETLLRHLETTWIAFLPFGVALPEELPSCVVHGDDQIVPILPRTSVHVRGFRDHKMAMAGWMAPKSIMRPILAKAGAPSQWTLDGIFAAAHATKRCFRWSSALAGNGEQNEVAPSAQTRLHLNAKVLAVVPHFRCEEFLAQALHSLVTQSRMPDGIAVVDDGSGVPPRDIVAAFPHATLLETVENVGPMCVLESIINATRYDAYLMQDADDWSASDRLERMLVEAERTGAELVGASELGWATASEGLTLRTFPLDVNFAMRSSPGHCILHGTTLMARELVDRVGGFSTGLRLGSDTEFAFRAHHSARVVNVPRFLYYRRRRPDSLTTSEQTRIGSAARRADELPIYTRARANMEAVRAGKLPDLRPLAKVPTAQLNHLMGPPLIMSR